MTVRTRRWNDAVQEGDGTRLLVTRYRPRGVSKQEETWHEWWRDVAPSADLHAAAYGKGQPAIDFEEYRRRYLLEMERPLARFAIRALQNRLESGETLTLLCSSACENESRCHRSLLRQLLLQTPEEKATTVFRRVR